MKFNREMKIMVFIYLGSTEEFEKENPINAKSPAKIRVAEINIIIFVKYLNYNI